MNFNANDAGEKPKAVTAGVYPFRCKNIQERTFGSGTEGFTAEIEVFIVEQNKLIKIWENFYYTKKALWRIRDFATSLGLKFRTGMEGSEFIGQLGKAYFDRKTGKKFLDPFEWIAKEGDNAQASPPIPESTQAKGFPPSQPTADDIPF